MLQLPKNLKKLMVGNPSHLAGRPQDVQRHILNACRLDVAGDEFVLSEERSYHYHSPGKTYLDTIFESSIKYSAIKPIAEHLPSMFFGWSCHPFPDARSVMIKDNGVITMDNRLFLLLSNITGIIYKTRQDNEMVSKGTDVIRETICGLAYDGIILTLPQEFTIPHDKIWFRVFLAELFMIYHEIWHLLASRISTKPEPEREPIHSLVQAFSLPSEGMTGGGSGGWAPGRFFQKLISYLKKRKFATPKYKMIRHWAEEFLADKFATIIIKKIAKEFYSDVKGVDTEENVLYAEIECAIVLCTVFHVLDIYNAALVRFGEINNPTHPTAFTRLEFCGVTYALWEPGVRIWQEANEFTTIANLVDIISTSLKTERYINYEISRQLKTKKFWKAIEAEMDRSSKECLGAASDSFFNEISHTWPY